MSARAARLVLGLFGLALLLAGAAMIGTNLDWC